MIPLAKYVTKLATIYSYNGWVKARSSIGRGHVIEVREPILNNILGGQDYIPPFVEFPNVYLLSGRTEPTVKMSGTFALFIIEKVHDDGFGLGQDGQLFRLGYMTDDKSEGLLVGLNGLWSFMSACRVAMWDKSTFHYGDNFWTAKVRSGLDVIEVTDLRMYVDTGSPTRLFIRRKTVGSWLKVCSVVAELAFCSPGSYQTVMSGKTVYKTAEDSYTLKSIEDDQEVIVTQAGKFFEDVEMLVEGFYYGNQDSSDSDFDNEFAEEYGDDEDDEGEGSAS